MTGDADAGVSNFRHYVVRGIVVVEERDDHPDITRLGELDRVRDYVLKDLPVSDGIALGGSRDIGMDYCLEPYLRPHGGWIAAHHGGRNLWDGNDVGVDRKRSRGQL